MYSEMLISVMVHRSTGIKVFIMGDKKHAYMPALTYVTHMSY